MVHPTSIRRTMPSQSVILGGMELPARDRELVRIVDAALADAARRAGEWLVCRIGCTQCCYGAFAISALDALRLRTGMKILLATEPALAAEIERRARDWIAQHGAEFPGDLTTGLLGESEEERDRFEEFANQAACPALDPATGRCDVYAWRPMTCRVFGPPFAWMAGWAKATPWDIANCVLRARANRRLPPASCRFRMSLKRSCWTRSARRAKRWWRSRCDHEANVRA